MIFEGKKIHNREFVHQFTGAYNSRGYTEFLSKALGSFDRTKKMQQDERICEPHALFERILFLAWVEHCAFKAKKKQYLVQLLQKYRAQLSNLLDKEQQIIETIEVGIGQYIFANLQYANQKIQGIHPKVISEYMAHFIRELCGKKEDKGFFGKKKSVYTETDLDVLRKKLDVGINVIDYDEKKQNAKTFQSINSEDIYLLHGKGFYYILYPKKTVPKKQHDLKSIQILGDSKISAKDLTNIFRKSDNEQPAAETMPRESLFPDQVFCSNCKTQHSEFDCLSWNYSYLCTNCVIDPQNDTSSIPPQVIQKYFRDHDIKINMYQIICPQCTATTKLKNYNPAMKPKFFQCGTCSKTICIEHSGNIYDCFCRCVKCHAPTVMIEKMLINLCVKCNLKFCFRCGKSDRKFCDCICKQCLRQNTKDHICDAKCHRCFNKLAKLRTCRCGMFVCSGCYYTALKDTPEGGNFSCGYEKYV